MPNYDRVRRDVGADAVSLPDSSIDAAYTEAAETFPTAGKAQDAFVRVILLRGMVADAARLTDYAQNESQDKRSQVFMQLHQLLTYWEGVLEEAEAKEARTGAVQIGAFRLRPKRIVDVPDS